MVQAGAQQLAKQVYKQVHQVFNWQNLVDISLVHGIFEASYITGGFCSQYQDDVNHTYKLNQTHNESQLKSNFRYPSPEYQKNVYKCRKPNNKLSPNLSFLMGCTHHFEHVGLLLGDHIPWLVRSLWHRKLDSDIAK